MALNLFTDNLMAALFSELAFKAVAELPVLTRKLDTPFVPGLAHLFDFAVYIKVTDSLYRSPVDCSLIHLFTSKSDK